MQMDRRHFLALVPAGAATVPMLLAPQPASAAPVPATLPATVENPSTTTPVDFFSQPRPEPPEPEYITPRVIDFGNDVVLPQPEVDWESRFKGLWEQYHGKPYPETHQDHEMPAYGITVPSLAEQILAAKHEVIYDGDMRVRVSFAYFRQMVGNKPGYIRYQNNGNPLPVIASPSYGYIANWEQIVSGEWRPFKSSARNSPTMHAGHDWLERSALAWLPQSSAFRRNGCTVWGEVSLREVRHKNAKLPHDVDRLVDVLPETTVSPVPDRDSTARLGMPSLTVAIADRRFYSKHA